jgi:hypothetical protein
VPRACGEALKCQAMKTGLAVSMASIIARVMSGVYSCAEVRARAALTRWLILGTELGLGVVHQKKRRDRNFGNGSPYPREQRRRPSVGQ